MSAIDNTPRAKAEALVGEVLTAALSAGEITVNQARAVTAALEAAMAPPEGYVLVPVEPTAEMLQAAAFGVAGKSGQAFKPMMSAGYSAMLAARPEVLGG